VCRERLWKKGGKEKEGGNFKSIFNVRTTRMTMLVVKKTSLGYIITMRIWNQGTIR
jgi:hypothetical protein